jgi:hypothetical protein
LLKELSDGHAKVARHLTQQRGRDVSACAERYCGAAAIGVPVLSMRAAASHLCKAEPLEIETTSRGFRTGWSPTQAT